MYMYMVYVMQLEDVTGEDDKAYIERPWGKMWRSSGPIEEAQIDQGDTDDDSDDEGGPLATLREANCRK